MPNYGLRLCVAVLIASLGTSALGQNNVVFLDGGLTELCASLATRSDTATKVTLTGSRLDQTPIAICTKAIVDERGAPTTVAGNYNNRGVLYFAENNYQAARADFEEALRQAPDMAQVQVNLGYVLIAQQLWAQSIAPLTRGIELGAADLAKVYYNRGIAYEESGQVTQAYRDYVAAAELAPEWDEPRRELTRFKVP